MQTRLLGSRILKVILDFRLRLSLVCAMLLLFVISFPLLYREFGPTAGALITIVVLFSSLLLGMKGGLVVWAVTIVVFILELTAFGNNGFKEVLANWPGILGTLLLTTSGLVKNLISHIWDQHEAAVESLRESEERFRTLYEGSSIGIYRTTPAGKILLANPAMLKMLGYSSFEELSTVTLGELVYEPSYNRKEFLDRIELNGEIRKLESVWTRKDGSTAYFSENARAVRDAEGRTLYYDGTVDDITERKVVEAALLKSEHLLRESQKAASIGYFVTDLRTGALERSPVLDEIYGIDASFISDLAHFEKMIVPQFRRMVRQQFISVMNEKRRFNLDYQIIRKADGEVRWINAVGELGYDEAGKPITMLGIIQDITERKHLEKQLLQAQKLEGVGTLAGGIAHDFNNLLALVLGSAELLQDKLADQPELKKYVDHIIEASERGASISRQLLIFSRPDQVKLKPISLSHTIMELQELLRHFLPKSINMTTDIDVKHGIIMGDSGQIHQALLNLALNAGDAMANAGQLSFKEYSVPPEFIAQTFNVECSVPHVAVSVSDTGTGMDESTLTKIFDPFFSTKDRGKGTGLGLAMVHGIVKNHNGFIQVSSTPGAGTTFVMYFPLLIGEREERVDEVVLPIQKCGEKILLVDDEEHLREMLTEYLCEMGYQVLVATNGQEALEIYRKFQNSIDLVITDLGMPHMGGEELYRQLKKTDPHVKVIVSSGYLDGSSTEHLLHLGIKDVLTKPSKLHDVHKAIRGALV